MRFSSASPPLGKSPSKKRWARLKAPDNLEEVLEERALSTTAYHTLAHALAVVSLPPIHQDPFDRIQAAQAKLENLILVTRDARLKQYGIPYIDA